MTLLGLIPSKFFMIFFFAFTDLDRHIYIDDIPLKEFIDTNIPNMTEYMKDKFVHITRMFDDRLKSFIKIILMNGKCEYYTYRIEFQLRHGLLYYWTWIFILP